MISKDKIDKYKRYKNINKNINKKNYREQFIHDILGNIKNKKGIEIGPDIYPVIKKNESDVIYVDIIHKNDVDVIVEKDRYEKYFDKLSYVVASHVFEHLSNPIRWLNSIYNILDKNAKLIMVIPDKRQTFDYKRKLTSVEDIISYDGDDYTESLKYDFYSNIVKYKGDGSWIGEIDESELVNEYNSVQSIILSRTSDSIHSLVFTSETFEEVIIELKKMGHIKFDKIEVFPTNGIEFITVFYKNEEI